MLRFEDDRFSTDIAETLPTPQMPTKATKKTDVLDAVDRNRFMLEPPLKLHVLQIS